MAGIVASLSIHKYNILANILQSSIHKYNILANILQTSIHKYDILANVLQSSIHKYSILANVIQASIHKYNILANILQTSIHKYNILNNIAQTSIHKYNILKNVLQASIHKYSLLQNILQSSIHKYSMAGNLIVTSIHKYSIDTLIKDLSGILLHRKAQIPRLKQILYPVYIVDERQRLERRRKLREYPPLIIIPAFKYNINKTVAPFVITDPVKNEVRVRFAINDSRHIAFTGKAVPIAITPSSQPKKINKAKCAHVMNQKAIEKYGKRLGKLHKLMALWSMIKQLE